MQEEQSSPLKNEAFVLPELDDDETTLVQRGDAPLARPERRMERRSDVALRRGASDTWRQRRGWILGVSALVLLAIIAGAGFAVLGNQGPRYTYSSVSMGNLKLSIAATGPVQSAEYDINFAGSGTISAIDVKVGQHVSAGDILAKLDATSLQDAVNQAQQAVNSAQTALSDAQNNQQKVQAQAQAQLNAAYSAEQSTINNACSNGSSSSAGSNGVVADSASCTQAAQDQYAAVQAQTDAEQSQAQSAVSNAQAQLNLAQAQLQTAQDNLKNATLMAPHDGTVAAINGTIGGTPGKSTSGTTSGNNTFIQLVDLSSEQVMANVNETDIGKVAVGQPVQFTVSAYGARRFNGTVSAISPVGQSSANVVTYPVTITVDAQSVSGANLLPGMTASATIITAQRYGVVLLPASAVSFARGQVGASGGITRSQARDALQKAQQMLADLQSASSGSGVDVSKDNPAPAFVLEPASKGGWMLKPVVLGLSDGTTYEVLAGLNRGERVATGTVSAVSSNATSSGGLFGGLYNTSGGNNRNGTTGGSATSGQ